MNVDPARKPKAQSRDNYKSLVGEMRSVRNSVAIIKWRETNANRVNTLPLDWVRAMKEEFDISLRGLLEKETGAKIEIREIQNLTETKKEPNMDLNSIFKSSDSLSAEDLQNSDVVLTIKSVEIVEFEDDGYKKQKPVLHFAETEKTLVSNKTNSMMIGEHHGYDTDGWPGQKITLYPTKTDFGGKVVDCIRVRAPSTGKTVSQGLPGQTGGAGDASLGHASQDIPPSNETF